MTSTEIAPRFRKTKTGEWVAYAPVARLRQCLEQESGELSVRKASGEWKVVDLGRIGKPFMADGVQMAYGYLVEDKRPARSTRPASNGRGGICDECGEPRRNLTECRDSSGISGMCCPRCASGPDYTRSFC